MKSKNKHMSETPYSSGDQSPFQGFEAAAQPADEASLRATMDAIADSLDDAYIDMVNTVDPATGEAYRIVEFKLSETTDPPIGDFPIGGKYDNVIVHYGYDDLADDRGGDLAFPTVQFLFIRGQRETNDLALSLPVNHMVGVWLDVEGNPHSYSAIHDTQDVADFEAGFEHDPVSAEEVAHLKDTVSNSDMIEPPFAHDGVATYGDLQDIANVMAALHATRADVAEYHDPLQ